MVWAQDDPGHLGSLGHLGIMQKLRTLSATSSSQHKVPGITISDLGKDKNNEEKRRRLYWGLGGIDKIEAKDYATATTTIYTKAQTLCPDRVVTMHETMKDNK